MFAPLLSTKLYIPRHQPLSQQATLVTRPRLIEQLEEGLSGKLTVLAAPAGFGKSTLLGEWIDKIESSQTVESQPLSRPIICWLSLEESDNDPIRFWLYFIAALQSMNPGLSLDTPTLLQSPEPPPLETILTILINDLSAWSLEYASRIALVLDDYHVITAPAIHRSLAFLLDHLPPTLHLIITTRADPPLPLARLRASGELSEIRAEELRFTAAETTTLLNERMGLHLSPDEVQILVRRTEGWIVGLRLAALSMYGHDDKASFLRSFAGDHRYILNYLVEEVLNRQSQAVQEFLLHTCILARLHGPLCDALIGVNEEQERETDPSPSHGYSQSMLEQIDQANLFLVPLDERGQWYRYHQLFAEVLQHRLRQSHPALLIILHQRASRWYAQQEYFTDAVQHALLAADYEYAAALIEKVWPLLWNQGAIATLLSWMRALPAERLSEFLLAESPLNEAAALVITNNQKLIEPLTKREIEVLHLLSDGLSNAAIATQLMVSIGTIKTHLKHIYGKFDVRSRTQAVAHARARGLL